MMSNILRRVQKLEAYSTDQSGYAPHSEAWFDYWLCRLTQILSGEEPGPPGCIPLAVWDAIDVEGHAAGGYGRLGLPESGPDDREEDYWRSKRESYR